MRKIVLSTIFAVLSICVSAQTPIKFLGIPVDGSKAEMIEKIKAKGYQYDDIFDVFTGEFNGYDVMFGVLTNNNKVHRVSIMETDGNNETQIKIRFNTLYHQFLNNGKYELISGKPISDSDRISYEMTVNKKQYEASFKPKDKSIKGVVWYTIAEHQGSYHICIYYDNTMNQAHGEDL